MTSNFSKVVDAALLSTIRHSNGYSSGIDKNIIELGIDVALRENDVHQSAQIIEIIRANHNSLGHLEQRIWQGNIALALALRYNNYFESRHVSDETKEKIVTEHLENALDQASILEEIADKYREIVKLNTIVILGQNPKKNTKLLKSLADSPYLDRMATREFLALADAQIDKKEFVQKILPKRTKQDDRYWSMIEVLSVHSEAFFPLLPWPRQVAKVSQKYCYATLAYVLAEINSKEEREILIALGENWQGSIEDLMKACKAVY